VAGRPSSISAPSTPSLRPWPERTIYTALFHRETVAHNNTGEKKHESTHNIHHTSQDV
jgi:hypothetical protein